MCIICNLGLSIRVGISVPVCFLGTLGKLSIHTMSHVMSQFSKEIKFVKGIHKRNITYLGTVHNLRLHVFTYF